MSKLNHRVVAITGAGSGIGRALAKECAARGANLALSDVNEAGLRETASQCEKAGAKVHFQTVDVASREAVEAWCDSVLKHFGRVHVIINNAGVALNADVAHTTYDDFEWLMGINFWGVVYGTKAFLPHIQKNDWGHIVNISSLFGLIGVPNQCAYNAAKFAVRGFTESLQVEMRMSDDNIGVSCVHPGGIKTNIANAARHAESVGTKGKSFEDMQREFNEKLARTTPEQAAEIILKAVENNHERVLVGMDAVALDRMQRVMPAGYRKLIAKFY
ncbi:MAG: SDR family NAD(P)-dependent oxidoreductase [Pseudomonadota bacterium]